MVIPRPSLSSRLRAKIALGLSVFVVLVAMPAAALAAVPMCDETAQSIAAPFPILPSHNGVIDALPCDAPGFEGFGEVPTRQQDRAADVLIPVERVVPMPSVWVPKQERVRAAVPRAASYRCPSEHRQSVYRPPR
jgi:hypothetical protein